MSEKFDQRYLPATTREEERDQYKKWKLTKSQYIFYYWLVAHSCWSKGQKHYYIYDKEWTITDAAKDCGVDRKTITRAVAAFEQKGILTRADNNVKAYHIYWPQDRCASLDKEMLKCFIGLGKVVDLPMFIKLYTLLLYGHANGVNDGKFAISDLLEALGVHTSLDERAKVLMMLGLWEHMHLIELKQETVRVGDRKPFIKYTIVDIKNNLDDIAMYLNDGKVDIKRAWVDFLQKQMVGGNSLALNEENISEEG